MANIISMERICNFQGGGEVEARLNASTPPTYVIRDVTDWKIKVFLSGILYTENPKLRLIPAVGSAVVYDMMPSTSGSSGDIEYDGNHEVTITSAQLSSLLADGYTITIEWDDTESRPFTHKTFDVSETYGKLTVKNASSPIIEKFTIFRSDQNGNVDALGEYLNINMTISSELPGFTYSISATPSVANLPSGEATGTTTTYSGVVGPGFGVTTSYRVMVSAYNSIGMQTLRSITIGAQKLVYDVIMDEVNTGMRFFGKATSADNGNVAIPGRLKIEDTSSDSKCSIRSGSGSSAVVLEPVANSNTNSLWVGHRGSTTKPFVGPYTNKDYNLGTSSYMFDNVYCVSVHFGGASPSMTSGGAQDWHMNMSETNYGIYYGVTESMWSFYPRTTQTSNLGTPNKRWLTIYSKNALNTSSDERLKKDINPLTDKYKKMILDLNPVSFKWHDNTDADTHAGFIAQDVERVMRKHELENGFVSKESDDGMYALRYEEFIAPMVAVMQEQQKKIDRLEKLVNQLISDADDDMK